MTLDSHKIALPEFPQIVFRIPPYADDPPQNETVLFENDKKIFVRDFNKSNHWVGPFSNMGLGFQRQLNGAYFPQR
jgi:hypothetical protein